VCVLIVSEPVAEQCVTFDEVEAAVREIFLALHAGQARVFEVVRATGAHKTTGFGVKSAVNLRTGRFSAKVGSYAPDNARRGLPAHTSTILVFDTATGAPVAMIGAGRLNGMRTAAANALAARLLAAPSSRVLGVLGTGHQAAFEAWAVCRVRPIERILCWARTSQSVESFATEVKAHTGIRPEFAECEQVARAADILATVTPSTRALVRREWVRPGTHIAAMGADAAGKQELDVELVRDSRVFVDRAEQAAVIGESQHAVRAGYLTVEDLQTRTLGALLAGAVQGRERADQITVFDSSGIALQDLAVAELVIERAAKRADVVRTTVSLLET
jgi:ornithine cyclodeaminase